MDFQANDGDVILAAHDGIVTFTGEDGSGGLGVVIRTKDQFEYKDGQSYFKTIYWHIKAGTFMVHPNDEVKSGQPIAQADNTGMSTGTHLHWGLKPVYQGEQDWQWYNLEQDNGYNGAIDPEPYLSPEILTKHQFNLDMRYGDENEEVKQLQIRLNVKPTGFYGNLTKDAVRKYAMSKMLSVTGKIVGPQIRGFLNG